MAKILVVDDTDMLRTLATRRLSRLGHEVVEAKDGQEALALLKGGNFDAIFSDVVMPNLNGLGLAEQAHASDDFDGHIVITSGGMTDAERAKLEGLLASGVVYHFLGKPYDPQIMISVVEAAAGFTFEARTDRAHVQGDGE